MYCILSVTLMLAACLAQPLRGEVLYGGEVFLVYPNLENVMNGTTPLYFALMQSFSGGYVSAGGIPGLMVALDEINSNSTVLPGYSLHYTLSDNAVGLPVKIVFGGLHDLYYTVVLEISQHYQPILSPAALFELETLNLHKLRQLMINALLLCLIVLFGNTSPG